MSIRFFTILLLCLPLTAFSQDDLNCKFDSLKLLLDYDKITPVTYDYYFNYYDKLIYVNNISKEIRNDSLKYLYRLGKITDRDYFQNYTIDDDSVQEIRGRQILKLCDERHKIIRERLEAEKRRKKPMSFCYCKIDSIAVLKKFNLISDGDYTYYLIKFEREYKMNAIKTDM